MFEALGWNWELDSVTKIHKFSDWIGKARISDDAAGDLISDLKRDPTTPAMFLSMRAMRVFVEGRGGCEGAINAVPIVWSRFSRWLNKHPYCLPEDD
jgi:hypothetical protein